MNKIESLIEELCPEGAPVKPLSSCVKLLAGDRVTKAMMTLDGAYPLYGAGMIPAGLYDLHNFENCMIVSRAGAGAGYVNFVPDKFWATDVCFVGQQIPAGPLIKFVVYWMK
jgi:type I restriction enzyme S subunit